MSFIEGIGDEVVLFFVIVFVFVVAALITLVGSVPRVATSAAFTGRYENNLFEQREISETSSTDSAVRVEHNRFPIGALHTNGFIVEENTDESIDTEDSAGISVDVQHTVNEAGIDLRTEADGSSVADTSEVLRTEADGSAELSALNVDSDQPIESQSVPISENSVEQREEVREPAVGEIRVRLKYLNDTERIVATKSCTKIGDFKKKHFREAIEENKTVRLIFAGRLLQDHSTIENCRIHNNSVVHVQVLQAQRQQNNQPVIQDTDLDMGRLLVPALTLLLGICWVLYSKYPEFFSTLSLGVLGTLSCFFLAYVVQSHR